MRFPQLAVAWLKDACLVQKATLIVRKEVCNNDTPIGTHVSKWAFHAAIHIASLIAELYVAGAIIVNLKAKCICVGALK